MGSRVDSDVGGVRVLVVEDDERMRATCVQLCERAGYIAHGVESGPAALAWLDANVRELIDASGLVTITDVRMPGMSGVELLGELRRRWPAMNVIVMTAFGSIDNAVEAMRLGAADYVTKPFNRDELLLAIQRVLKLREPRSGTQATLDPGEPGRFANVVAESERMQPVVERLAACARSGASVLITGESGTGKDLLARTIHFAGPRADGPFVPVNCASLPRELIESELFGHVRGAYTGATATRVGLIRRAHGGTLFLDEVIEMPADIQAKLLRVLQDMHVRPVGGTEEEAVDVRIIAATNSDIESALARGKLREDLYYRLNVLTIEVPPLRERPEDLEPLLQHFLRRENEDRSPGQRIDRVERAAVDRLRAHDWPGNVRELENLIKRFFALGITGTLDAEAVDEELSASPPARRRHSAGATGPDRNAGGDAPPFALADVEREAVQRALERTESKAAAARLLGISRKTLYRKIREYELDA